ncbi:MAG: DUF4835 family protein [Bacteroidia bacterium]|nr:DUF4835 family protein [Bacteroidia bacterium]
MKKIAILITAIMLGHSVFSQELDCKLQVMSQQIQGTNKQVFRTLQNELFEFMNNHKWTDNIFSNEERIDCNININITEELSVDEFKGTMQVQARRPVFNSSYNSVLLNYQDNNIQFKYVEFEPIQYNEISSNSSLVSLMAYYAYIIIGLDYDSFSSEGGSPWFQKAESIVTRNQNAQEKGWKAFESLKNRYWLTENLLNDRYSGIRQCYYMYHRLGLDVMSDKVSEGRAQIASGLELLQSVHRDKPGSFLMQLFFDAKADELVNIFTESFTDEQDRVVLILNEIDPSNSAKYNKIKTTNTVGNTSTQTGSMPGSMPGSMSGSMPGQQGSQGSGVNQPGGIKY